MRGKTLVGIIELQLNNQEIYRLLADYTGLGETGETVVVSLRNDKIIYMAPTRRDPDAAFRRQIWNRDLPKYRALYESSQGRTSTSAETVTDYGGKAGLGGVAIFAIVPLGNGDQSRHRGKRPQPSPRCAAISFVIALFAVLVVIGAALYVARSISNRL